MAKEKGYDGAKKITGIKRHIAVDSQGLPHGIHVTTANISDKAGAIELFSLPIYRFPELISTLFDGGYRGVPFEEKVASILSCTVQVVTRPKLHEFQVMPKRWVVERTFAWLEKYRRLSKNFERKISTSKQMVVFACLALLLKRIK
jgi:transposase